MSEPILHAMEKLQRELADAKAEIERLTKWTTVNGILAIMEELAEARAELAIYKENNPKGYAAANRYREQRDRLAEALRYIRIRLGDFNANWNTREKDVDELAKSALAAVEGGDK